MVYLLWCTAASRPDVSNQSVNLQGLGGGGVVQDASYECATVSRGFISSSLVARELLAGIVLFGQNVYSRTMLFPFLPHRHLSLRRRRTCTFLSSSTRGEWVWSYPDPDAEEGEEGKGKGGADGGNGEGADEAEEGSFSLALHDEVRFRVRTLEFTQVGGR